MDNISDKIDLAIKVVATGCSIGALVIAAKTYKSFKSFEADDMAIDEQEQYDSNQIDNTDIQNESNQIDNTDIQNESDQTNN